MTATRSLITTRPKCAPCPRCARLQLTGHTEGLAYRADPLPVTVHAELAARRVGRSSYFLYAVDALALRTASRIHGDTRGRPPVVLAHICEQPPDATAVAAEHADVLNRLVRRALARETTDVPAPIAESESDALFTLSRELGATIVGFDPPDAVPPF